MEFFVQNLAPIMFAGLIFFLLLGFPVAFSLGACGLFFRCASSASCKTIRSWPSRFSRSWG